MGFERHPPLSVRQRFAAAERQIDQVVCELYDDPMGESIRIIGEATERPR